MIIGTITLISMLFFGGIQQYFFVDKLEKGIKQFVEEKDRRKEILADLKNSKSTIDAFNKERKSNLKVFYAMNLNRDTKVNELEDFFKLSADERKLFQDKLINERLLVVSKINEEEWEKIIALSTENVQKQLEKSKKKQQKDAFESLFKTIEKSISEQDRQAQAYALVKNFQNRYNQLNEKVQSVNTLENDLLNNKSTGAFEFEKFAEEVNLIRKTAYLAFIHFHFDVKEITNETEWTKIMKEFNKLIS